MTLDSDAASSASITLRAHIDPIIRDAPKEVYAKLFFKPNGKPAYNTIAEPLTEGQIQLHLDSVAPIAICLMRPGTDTTSLAAYDLDDHDSLLSWEDIARAGRQILNTARQFGLNGWLVRSGRGRGAHIWFRWDKRQSARDVRSLLETILSIAGYDVGEGGIAKSEVEIFPKQDSVPEDGLGSVIALPFARQSVPLDTDFQPINMPKPWLSSADTPLAPSPDGEPDGDDVDMERVRDALTRLSADDYSRWIQVGLALKHALGDPGFLIWNEWSRKSEKYEGESDAQKQWDRFKSTRGSQSIGLGSIFYWAKQAGWKDHPREKEAQWALLIDITSTDVAVPPFPTNLLPHPFSDFVKDVAHRMQSPADYVAIPLIVVAATMLGRKVRIRPKQNDDWSERPCLWGMVIAPSGTKKSPAAEAALRPIQQLQSELIDQYKIAHALWRQQKGSEDAGDEPRLRSVYVNDPTVEALVSLIENSDGLLLHRDELVGWYRGLNKYRRGGDDRQFYLQCWSGGTYRVDRKTTASAYVNGLYLNIFGTIQPDVASEMFQNAHSDGLTARFQVAAYPTPPETVEFIDELPNFDAAKGVMSRLKDLFEMPSPDDLRFDSNAQQAFKDWLTRNENRPERKDSSPFGIHISKYPALYARIALVLHFMKHGRDAPPQISAETAEATRALIDDYFERHARRIYKRFAAHPASAGAVRIAKWISGNRITEFGLRDVRRPNWKEFSKERDDVSIMAALNYLEANGWVVIEEKKSGSKGGRPTIRARVNPAVHGDQAEAAAA